MCVSAGCNTAAGAGTGASPRIPTDAVGAGTAGTAAATGTTAGTATGTATGTAAVVAIINGAARGRATAIVMSTFTGDTRPRAGGATSCIAAPVIGGVIVTAVIARCSGGTGGTLAAVAGSSTVIAGLPAAGLAFTCVGRIVLKANGKGVVIHRSVD